MRAELWLRGRGTLQTARIFGLLISVLWASPGFAVTQKPAGSYIVRVKEDLTVRTNPKGYAIGNLYNQDQFYLQSSGRNVAPNKYYSWGHAGGTADLCGWVEHKFLTPGGDASAACSTDNKIESPGTVSFNYLKKYYASKVNLSAGGGSKTTLIRKTEVWGNWDRKANKPHHPLRLKNSDQHFPLQPGDKVRWRWITKGGDDYAMVNMTPADLRGRVRYSTWVFIRRAALRPDLSYR